MKNGKKIGFFLVMIDFVHNFQVFWLQNRSKNDVYLKSQQIRNVLVGVFIFMIFFLEFLVFELWLILYRPLGLSAKNLEENFANLIQTLTSSDKGNIFFVANLCPF